MCTGDLNNNSFGSDGYDAFGADLSARAPLANIGAKMNVGRGTGFTTANATPYAKINAGPIFAGAERQFDFYIPDGGEVYSSQNTQYRGGFNTPFAGGKLNLTAEKDDRDKGVFLRFNTKF